MIIFQSPSFFGVKIIGPTYRLEDDRSNREPIDTSFDFLAHAAIQDPVDMEVDKGGLLPCPALI